MKKVITLALLLLLTVSVSYAGDVRINAKSTLNTETPAEAESSWWDDVCEWVDSIF
jgi:hypothetical protein